MAASWAKRLRKAFTRGSAVEASEQFSQIEHMIQASSAALQAVHAMNLAITELANHDLDALERELEAAAKRGLEIGTHAAEALKLVRAERSKPSTEVRI